MHELVARAHGLLRRMGASVVSEVDKLRAGALSLDAATRQVWLDEPDGAREIKLTSKEFGLLHFLMAHQGESSRVLHCWNVFGAVPIRNPKLVER